MKATQWKLGLSSIYTDDVGTDTFKEFAQGGIDAIEVSLTPQKYYTQDWKRVKKDSADTGVSLWSFHLPFYPFAEYNIASLDKNIRDTAVSKQYEMIDVASSLEIDKAVIHASGEPNKDSERDEMIKCAQDSLYLLAKYAESRGVTIAVEDLPRTCLGNCSDDISRLISAHEKLRVCFDLNHLLIQKNVDFVKALGDKIITLHVSDYDFKDERHWLPYEGKTDWVELVTALENADYNGVFMYEIRKKAPDTILRRDLECSDFVANYKACVNKTPFEGFGKPTI